MSPNQPDAPQISPSTAGTDRPPGARSRLTRYAWLSVATSVVVIGLKVGAWWATGSVALLSDAMESGVNLIAAVIALISLAYAARGPDEDHHFGHDKVEYFSSGVEGGLIFVAAAVIIWTSLPRIFAPVPIEGAGLGLALALLASAGNAATAWVLLKAGRQHHSITLEADGRHLMTDVVTTGGVVLGLVLVSLTGWLWLDPLIALGVALHILREGFHLMKRSFDGLMDKSLPPEELAQVMAILNPLRGQGYDFHALRTRTAGRRRFVDVHVLVPGRLSVQEGHDIVEAIEESLRSAIPHLEVLIHLEPLEDPRAWQDSHPA